MKLRLLLVWLLLLASFSRPLAAEERYRDFLQGLRDRHYFDYAIFYLDQLSSRESLPEEIRQIIPYERAVTLRESAKAQRNPEKQFEQLDQALAFLEQFSRDYPNNPNAADANADRAEILLQKAEVEVTQSKSSANKSSKGEFQRRGREYVSSAQKILKVALDQHETAFKKFPAYIDDQKEPKLHAERDRIERSLALESISLAKCTYYEAQTYDSTSKQFKQLLTQAGDEFEKVHQKYRSQVGGLTARVWQGKCFEEQGDYQKALGIYDELLKQPGDSPPMVNLKSQTLQFKLICLRAREEYQPIVDLADEWLNKNAGESRTSVGLGIQWEQARAWEAMGDNRSLPKGDQERYWRQARTAAQQINRFAGEYKDVSLAMQQRLQLKLGGKERKADDFETAFGLARQSFSSAEEIKKELDAETREPKSPEEVSRLKHNWTSELNDAARNFEVAMSLANRRDNPKEIATARLLQAYTNFFLRRNYEAAILAEYLTRTAGSDEDDVALKAAHMAMAAYVQAYNDNKAEADQKSDDIQLIVKAADVITGRWPDSDEANEAKMVLGRIFTSAKNPVEAAAWFSKIPESDPMFPEAQLSAGQAYWVAYASAFRQPEELRPTVEKLTEWKKTAETYLINGITKMSATLPDEGIMPQELLSGKIYLAELYLSQGREADAAKLLLDDPQSVTKAIAVDDESERPDTGVQSRPVAKSVYILLLRAYIGMGLDKLNDARETMKTLESIVAKEQGTDLTDLYVGFGHLLKSELERLRSNKETDRFKKLMKSFESFLDDMSKKQEGQTFGSLSWIGETYAALGEFSTDKSRTASYYNRAAAAFSAIVSRAETDPKFATSEQLLNVKVRLVHCNRLKQDFADAERLLIEILKARGNDLRTQVEGASLYQDWGADGDGKKFITAISGNKDIGLWGWGGIAKRIQQQKNYAERPEFAETILDARYGVSLCRFLYCKELPAKEKQKALGLCATELIGTASLLKSLPDEKRTKLNTLYRQVQQEAGKPVTDLPRSNDDPPAPTNAKEVTDNDEHPPEIPDTKASAPVKKAQPAPNAQNSDSTTWLALAAFLVVGAGVAGFVVLKGGRKRPKTKAKPAVKPKAIGRLASGAEFTGIAIEKSLPTFPATTTAARPQPKSTERTATPSTSSASVPQAPRPLRRTDPSAAPPTKPRPRPPQPPPDE